MNPQAPDLVAVVARLDKLERQNRRLKRALGLLVVVGAAVLLVSPNQPGQAEQAKQGKDSRLVARSIALLDENGEAHEASELRPSKILRVSGADRELFIADAS